IRRRPLEIACDRGVFCLGMEPVPCRTRRTFDRRQMIPAATESRSGDAESETGILHGRYSGIYLRQLRSQHATDRVTASRQSDSSLKGPVVWESTDLISRSEMTTLARRLQYGMPKPRVTDAKLERLKLLRDKTASPSVALELQKFLRDASNHVVAAA